MLFIIHLGGYLIDIRIKGLKWADIDGDFIRIQRFIDDKNRVINSIKGNTADGIRSMPLTPATKARSGSYSLTIRNLFSIVATALWQPLPSIGI